jgi:hypothetical protein
LTGYNSIGAFSTINHLHFQLFDIRHIGYDAYLENVLVEDLWEINEYLTMGKHHRNNIYNSFCLKLKDKKLSTLGSDELQQLSDIFMNILDIFHALNQPYNLLIKENAIHIIPR